MQIVRLGQAVAERNAQIEADGIVGKIIVKNLSLRVAKSARVLAHNTARAGSHENGNLGVIRTGDGNLIAVGVENRYGTGSVIYGRPEG